MTSRTRRATAASRAGAVAAATTLTSTSGPPAARGVKLSRVRRRVPGVSRGVG